MNGDWLELYRKEAEKTEITRILNCNMRTQSCGLILTEEEAKILLARGRETLREQGRVELGQGILPALIDAFCDSSYISQDSYVETLAELTEVFYQFKNEACDCLTDEELINFMREQFDEICCGSVLYLADTCLERFARAIRAGYGEYQGSSGKNEYGRLSEEMRWDRELYLEELMNQF